MKSSHHMIENLYEIVASLTSAQDCRALFEDMCTFKEIEQMAQRVYAAKLLLQGQTYAQVIAQTNISSATLSRVSRSIQHGSGGYARLLNIDADSNGKID